MITSSEKPFGLNNELREKLIKLVLRMLCETRPWVLELDSLAGAAISL